MYVSMGNADEAENEVEFVTSEEAGYFRHLDCGSLAGKYISVHVLDLGSGYFHPESHW
jgi:hypothetical protein